MININIILFLIMATFIRNDDDCELLQHRCVYKHSTRWGLNVYGCSVVLFEI